MFNQIASQKNPPRKPWPVPNFNPFHIHDFDLTDSIGRFLSITDGRKSALQGIKKQQYALLLPLLNPF